MPIPETKLQTIAANSYGLKFSQLVNPTKLYEDYLAGGLSDFYRYNFLDSSSAVKAAAAINSTAYDRRSIHNIVDDANRRLGAGDKTLANIELLRQANTLCIFAGQQVSFCAHPMYIIYKAITAVKLAERYSKELNRPVVPCFWMATDDHDFEEVRNANFLQRSGEMVTLTYSPTNDLSGYPVAEMTLDDGVNDFCKTVDDALIDTEFKAPLLDIFKDFYKVGNKLSEAFARVLNHFLGDLGIILVDPNFPGMKDLFQPVFKKEITGHDQTFNLYEQRCKKLQQDGYHIQVHKSGENLNMFYHGPKRSNIVIENSKFKIDGYDLTFTQDQLLAEVDKSPAQFSSNVLLRPIAQCAAFPTLAHVVGPSELAYFAQIEPLFEYFEVPFPIAFPRAGMTIVEPHINKIIKKYDLQLSELKNDLEMTIGSVVERLFPSVAANNVVSLSDCMARDLDELAIQLKQSDPEGERHVLNFAKQLDFDIKQLTKKLQASNKKRHEELTGQMRRAHAFLFPNGGLQERLISPLYYANKFGPGIFQAIYDNLEVDKPAHTVLEL